MSDANDPWASLADTLGAKPAPESAQPTPAPARPTETRRDDSRRVEARRPAPPVAGGDWSEIVTGLGLEPEAKSPPRPATPPPRPAPPAFEPPRTPLPRSDSRPEGGDRFSEPPRQAAARGDQDEPLRVAGPPASEKSQGGEGSDFLDRPVADRGGRNTRRGAGDQADGGRRGGRQGDGRRRDDRGPRDEPRGGEGSRGGDEPRSAEREPTADRFFDEPRRSPPRSAARPSEATPAHSGETAFDGDDDIGAHADSGGVADGPRVTADGERSEGEPRRGRRRRGRRGGRGRGGRERSGERLEQQPPDGDSETPNGAGRGERDDLSDLNFTSGDEERAIRNDRGDQESRRPPRGEAPRERSAGRREPVDRDSPRAERPSRPEAASGRTSSPPSAPTGGFDWDAPLERAPIDRAEASRGADDDAWGGSGSESRPRSGGSSAGEGEARGDGSDDQSGRRRRRRGRRGGRRRGGRERVGDEQAAGPRETSPGAGSPGDTHEDEPLPAGYGRAPQAPRPGVEGGKSDEAGRAGDGESRGRRRRGRGERRDEGGRPARSGGEVGTDAGESRGRGRSSRRRGRSGGRSEPELRPTSSLSRGRREDFAPVAGGYEEDDEGLDFLGIEDTGREGSPQRESRRGDDDEILVESVSDVPSWVEAIGIVIAGNLDARNRPPRGDDHDRGRRDQQRGGRS